MKMTMRRSTIALPLTFLLAVVMTAGCSSRNVDLQKTLKVTDITTGWLDAGVQSDGQNKLVPTISFRLQNAGAEPVTSVQLLSKFNVIGDQEELGSSYVKGIGSEGLEAGKSTSPFVLQANIGYKGQESRAAMLQNSHFQDAQVELYGKYMANGWVKLGTYRITRQLLTR